MYQPNFCAHCGGRIVRAHWHLWTSRRFCSECAPRLRAARFSLPAFASLAVFSLGLFAGSRGRPATPPLTIAQHQPTVTAPQTARTQPLPPNTKTDSAPATAKPVPLTDSIATERPADSTETVSLCGALTKKGTPCQRRVRGTGRCYQHKGQPAIIPLEQRMVTEK